MKKYLKRIISVTLLLCMVIVMFPIQVFGANELKIAGVGMGYSAGDYFSTTGRACTCHGKGLCVPQTSSCTCIHVSGTAQCYAFALWCEQKLFGKNDVANPNDFYSIGSIKAGSVTASSLKNLLYGKAKPGAHIRTYSSEHSMVIVSIDENGFTVAQANGGNNKEYSGYYACRIGTTTYTWASYASSSYGSRGIAWVKMPRNYTLTEHKADTSYVNLLPFQAYPSSTGNVTVYDASGTAYSNRYITGSTDLCTINEVYTDGWCKVTYPTSSGSFTAYVPLETFMPNFETLEKWTSDVRTLTVYRRSSGSETLGSVSLGDVCYKIGGQNDRMQVLYPTSSGYKLGWITSHAPIGQLDNAKGGLYSVNIGGWAFDEDDPEASLAIHAYIGDKLVGAGWANLERKDVNNIYGCGNNHGYNFWIDVDSSLAGTQVIKVYAINVGSGYNVGLGEKTVQIDEDKNGPVITDCKVTNVTSEGYTVTCKVTDESGVERVQFPTWTEKNGQDDLIEDWGINPEVSGKKEGDIYTYQVKISAHNYETGRYQTHIYAYDKYGNINTVGVGIVVVPAPETTDKDIVQSGTCGTNVTWSLDNKGVLKISGSGDMKNYSSKSGMPWYAYASQITSVEIENGITSIGSYAFYGMSNLQMVNIAESVKTIGAYTFKNCSSLITVKMPETLTKIGESAFYGCSNLEKISIPEGIYTIWAYTFKNCIKLKEVSLPSTLIKLDEAVFYGCSSLKTITIPDNVSIIGSYCFKNCTQLNAVILPAKLTGIREAAFYGTAITQLNIPEKVTTIGKYAFKNCEKLNSIYLPSGLEKIEESAFYACVNLQTLELPDGVKQIGNYAFRKCIGLQKVNFSSDLEIVGESAFYGCTSLKEIALKNKVTEIGAYAFKNCVDVSEIQISSALKTMGESAFYGCINIKSIEIPYLVSKVGNYAFAHCNVLSSIIFTGNAPVIGTEAFKGVIAEVSYPSTDITWTEDKLGNYGGQLNWKISP